MLSPVSLFFVMILSSLMSLAVLGSLRFAAVPGVRRWMAANLLLIVAVVLLIMQGLHVSKLLTFVVANVLYVYSVVLIYEGCRQFLGLRAVTLPPYIGCLCVLLGIWYWLVVSPDFDARVAVMSAVHAILYASIGWVAWSHRPARQVSYSYGFVLVASWIGAAAHAVRGAVYGMGWVPQQTALFGYPGKSGPCRGGRYAQCRPRRAQDRARHGQPGGSPLDACLSPFKTKISALSPA